MKKHLTYIITLFLCSSSLWAQEFYDVDSVKNNNEEVFHFRPQISLGTGMFTFFGDVANNNGNLHPTVSRLARDLRISQALNSNFDLSFYVLFGQISANERTLTRNLNFQSNITTGGATVTYNFHNILKPTRVVNPYISLGIESIEFLSKSDLKDKNGETYHYWSDGTIRDLSETSANASDAKEIFRDYTYESDLREANLDGFGQYQERTLAIPIDIGANFHLSKRIKARLGASMHFTFSDLIDNVTNKSEGFRAGDTKNDRFLYTHFALTYDIGKRRKKAEIKEQELELSEEELLAADTSDYDGDGVYDLIDDCIKTPKQAFPVDAKGCPLDDDKDYVPNFRDDELNSLFGHLVNERGIAMYEEDLERRYRAYIDSNGTYFAEERHVTISGEEGLDRKAAERAKNNLKYTIVIGTDSKEISANELYQYLSYKDFKTVERGDSVFYVIGGFESISEAVIEKQKLEIKGVKTDGIALIKGRPTEIKRLVTNVDIKKLTLPHFQIVKPVSQSIYRIQIGAFNVKISNEAFGKINDLEVVKGDDGLYRYYTGAFTSKNEAINHKISVLEKGYSGAIVTVFKDGRRISLEEAGFEITNNIPGELDTKSEPTKGILTEGLVKYRVQVGAYQNDIPTNVLDAYLNLGDVLPRLDNKTMITKYLVGKFDTYQEAQIRKNEIRGEGLQDAFIVGDLNGKIITTKEALELTK